MFNEPCTHPCYFLLLLNLSKYLVAGVLLFVFHIVQTMLYEKFVNTYGRVIRGDISIYSCEELNFLSFAISFRYSKELRLENQPLKCSVSMSLFLYKIASGSKWNITPWINCSLHMNISNYLRMGIYYEDAY